MALCQFHSLEAVFFDENELTGGIPACFSQLKELSQLYLFNNQLYGEIPNELSVLLSLGKFVFVSQLIKMLGLTLYSLLSLMHRGLGIGRKRLWRFHAGRNMPAC